MNVRDGMILRVYCRKVIIRLSDIKVLCSILLPAYPERPLFRKKIQEKEFQVREKLSSNVFSRVMDGFERSDRTKMDILRFIKMLKTADQFEYLHLQTDR